MINRDVEQTHPLAREAFTTLSNELLPLGFRVFETVRDPLRQAECRRLGTSKAGPWQSPHNYGLAVDFVRWVDGKWDWSGDYSAVSSVVQRLFTRTLEAPLAWDPGHVQFKPWRPWQV